MDTMTQARWNAMTPAEKAATRDLSGLSPQLIGLEGWRVEVTRTDGEKARFNVGRSTGWRPCHLEVYNRRDLGGPAADREYATVRTLYRV